MSTPYYVMPIQAADGTLPASVNDPGPAPLTDQDCAPPEGIEFALLDDYEGMDGTANAVAYKSYTYNDSTCEVMPVALLQGVTFGKDWEPPSTPIPWGPRCGSVHAMHLAGIYSDWGGGLATLIMNHVATLNPDLSHPNVPFTQVEGYWKDDVPIPYVPQFSSADLSAWDGIAFWARRGPYGEPGFRPGFLDRTSAGDLNKHLPPEKAACRSVYTVCSCLNNKPCTPWDPAINPGPDLTQVPQTGCRAGFPAEAPDVAGTYCWDPKVDKWPSADPTLRCGQTACNYRPDTPIPTMIFNPTSDEAALLDSQDIGQGLGVGTIPCSPEPYVFHDSTLASAKFCYRPGIDADPPEKADRCENPWLGPTDVDMNWKRYMIPFADLRQDNTAPRKLSPGIDLTAVEVLGLVFPAGNLDIWIDDVGFYRKKK
jgi:hypothetical protein